MVTYLTLSGIRRMMYLSADLGLEGDCMSKRSVIPVIVMILIMILTLGMLAGCDTKENEDEVTSFDQLHEAGRKIGVGIGTGNDVEVKEAFPDAKVYLFNDANTGYIAVVDKKIDAFVYGRKQMELAIKNGRTGLKLLDETVGEASKVAVGLSPEPHIDNLEDKINQFIAEKKADGTLDDMYNRWVVLQSETMPDILQPDNPSGTLKVATCGIEPPFSYYVGTELNGYDIELAKRFASWLNTDLELKTYDYSGMIAAAQSGDVDCIMAELFVTPEREEAIPFSDVLFQIELGVVIKEPSGRSLSDSLRSGFYKTFVREDRWKLFVSGIGTTLLITVFSILFGTSLGFGVYMLTRNKGAGADHIAAIIIRLVRGMPVVVLLMILYYIIFGGLAISGTVVSIIAFTLVFGSGVYCMVGAGVGAVDHGQLEAAYTLGYTDRQAFFRIILPQAMPHFMPEYKASITELIKATAIVGYVAVQDLTKMGDIIRSRTYEAFFPLIAVAVIYYFLADILTYLVNRIELNLDPRHRKLADFLKEGGSK